MTAGDPADLPTPPVQRLFPGDLLAEFLKRGDAGGPRARLEAIAPGQLEVFAASGWHCARACTNSVSYLAVLRCSTRSGQERQRGWALCGEHARAFAAAHGLDLAAVPPPEREP